MVNFSDFKLSDLKKTYPPKSGLALVIGFDTVKKFVRFWRVTDLNFAEAEVREFPYKESFLSEEFFNEFRKICADYVSTLPENKQMVSYLVMSDNMVSMDNVSLPYMKRKNRDIALSGHLRNLYKNYKDLQFNKYIVSSNKQYITFILTILKKSRLTELYRAVTECKLPIKAATFTGNCLINSVLHFKPNLRKKSFIFLDIHNEYTNVAVCVKGRTAAFASFMLGAMHLTSERVLQENMQYDHDVANLAIINAKEKAKMKQLTVAGADLESELGDGVRQFDDDERGESTVFESAKGKEVDLQSIAEDLASTAEERETAARFEEEDAAEEEKSQNELLKQEQIRKKKVFVRKIPKRLPKFMLRPEPADAQGVIYENFRMFIKWAMLYYKWIKEQVYLHEFDCVLVNMPEKYAFLIDRANGDEESELPFEYMGADETIADNLEMIGALFSGVYNKRENF